MKNSKALKRMIHMVFKKSPLKFFTIIISILIFKICSTYSTKLIQVIIDKVLIPKRLDLLPKYITILGLIYLISICFEELNILLAIPLSQDVMFGIRKKSFEKLQNLPIVFFDTHEHGDIMSKFTNDIDSMNTFLEFSMFNIFSGIVEMIALLAIMIYISYKLAIVVIFFSALSYVIIYLFSKYSIKSYDTNQKNIGSINGYIEESVNGQNIVKLFNYEKRNNSIFKRLNNAWLKSIVSANIYSNTIFPVIGTINFLQYACIAIVGTIFHTSIGTIGSFLLLSRLIAMPLFIFSFEVGMVNSALAGAKRVFELMDLDNEIDEGKVYLKDGYWILENNEKVKCVGNIEFINVDFSYNKDKKILKNINMYAKYGQKIAIVGPTGSGKTTITNLINRFYEIDNGTITFDGIDIRRINKSDLRKNITVVLQDSILFSGTILDNIRYSDETISKEEVIKVAKQIGAHHFISQLEKGYETYISGNTDTLSQGQKQLLCLVRAKLRNTPVLILDEATSNIDTRTEKIVQDGMDKLMRGKTVFVIAHRLSTIIDSDVIMVLENGEIIERGTHAQLLAKNNVYANLYNG